MMVRCSVNQMFTAVTSWTNPPFTLDQILEALAKIGVPQ
jgi:hypothetical protein